MRRFVQEFLQVLLPHDRVRVGAVAVRFVGNRQQNEASMLHLGRLPKETKSRVVRLPRLRTSLLYSRSAFDAFALHIHSGFRGCDWMDDFLCHRWNLALRFPCPRCGKWFFAKWWYHNNFARKCVHCGLPKWADPNAGSSQ
jgi:hypothetical protein